MRQRPSSVVSGSHSACKSQSGMQGSPLCKKPRKARNRKLSGPAVTDGPSASNGAHDTFHAIAAATCRVKYCVKISLTVANRWRACLREPCSRRWRKRQHKHVGGIARALHDREGHEILSGGSHSNVRVSPRDIKMRASHSGHTSSAHLRWRVVSRSSVSVQ
jgi:hypothetical protein